MPAPTTLLYFVTSLAERLETAFSGARQCGADAHEEQRQYYDGAVRHRPYAEGDLVWLHNPMEDRMRLAPHWKGPYRVLAVLDSQGEPGLTYRIDNPLNGQKQVVHYDRLKLYALLMPAGSSSSFPTSPLHASFRMRGRQMGNVGLRSRWWHRDCSCYRHQ